MVVLLRFRRNVATDETLEPWNAEKTLCDVPKL